MKTNNKKNTYKRSNNNTNKNTHLLMTHYIASKSGNANDDAIALPIGLLKQYIPLSILTDRLNKILENKA